MGRSIPSAFWDSSALKIGSVCHVLHTPNFPLPTSNHDFYHILTFSLSPHAANVLFNFVEITDGHAGVIRDLSAVFISRGIG